MSRRATTSASVTPSTQSAAESANPGATSAPIKKQGVP